MDRIPLRHHQNHVLDLDPGPGQGQGRQKVHLTITEEKEEASHLLIPLMTTLDLLLPNSIWQVRRDPAKNKKTMNAKSSFS